MCKGGGGGQGCIRTAVHRRRRGVPPLPLDPLLPFQCLRLTAKILLRCQEDLGSKHFWRAFGDDHRGTLGGGGSQPNPPPPPPFRPPLPPCNTSPGGRGCTAQQGVGTHASALVHRVDIGGLLPGTRPSLSSWPNGTSGLGPLCHGRLLGAVQGPAGVFVVVVCPVVAPGGIRPCHSAWSGTRPRGGGHCAAPERATSRLQSNPMFRAAERSRSLSVANPQVCLPCTRRIGPWGAPPPPRLCSGAHLIQKATAPKAPKKICPPGPKQL